MNGININTDVFTQGTNNQVSNASASLGEDDFLKLLAVQLQYQDPLEPMENTEFIAQMAQFSTLEGITGMNESMTMMSEQIISMNNLSTTSLIGKKVKVFGDDITIAGGETKELEYLLMQGAQNVKINIADENGVRIRTIDVGSQQAGSNKIVWDGLDDSGVAVPAGDYTFSIEATNTEGEPVNAATVISDEVDGIVYENGVPYLMIDDTMVGLHEILEVWG